MSIDLRPLTSQDADVQRGMSRSLAPDDDPLRIFKFTSECARGELIGVTLGLAIEGNECCDELDCAGPFALPAVRAKLEWALGSACFCAEADFLHGTTLAVVAERLQVCAEYIVWGDRCAPWLPVYKVSAGAGYVARSSNSNPARFTELVTVGAGQQLEIAIPNFAISLTLQPADFSFPPAPPPPAVTRIGVLGPCGPRVVYDVVSPLSNLGQHNVENALPIFNGATKIEIDNTGGATPLALFLIFGLAL